MRSSSSTNVVSIHARLPDPLASISKSRAARPTDAGGASTLNPANVYALGRTLARESVCASSDETLALVNLRNGRGSKLSSFFTCAVKMSTVW